MSMGSTVKTYAKKGLACLLLAGAVGYGGYAAGVKQGIAQHERMIDARLEQISYGARPGASDPLYALTHACADVVRAELGDDKSSWLQVDCGRYPVYQAEYLGKYLKAQDPQEAVKKYGALVGEAMLSGYHYDKRRMIW